MAVTTDPLGRVPALDGVRALAVLAVLLYHGQIPGVDGGFLGVSVFFTLSGFLITSLLLRERFDPTRGRIDLRAFWSRRFRRLLAASWLTIGVVLAMGALGIWQDSQLRDLRGDVPWSLAELLNWHLVAEGTSYAASQTPPSPLQHYWSLAIEQQFYLVLPVLLVGLLAVGRGRGRRPGAGLPAVALALTVLMIASAAAAGLHARTSIDRAYFGTDSRAAELLVGALLAVALLRRLRFGPRGRRGAVIVGIAGAAILACLFHVARQTSPWLYPWGLLLTATCTAAVVTACIQPGPIAALLSRRPLVALGTISYGVYLLHWPVFLWLTPARTGLHGSAAATAALFAIRVAVTLVAAAVMFRWVEAPVRRGGVVTARRALVALPCAAIVLLATTAWLTGDLPPPPAFLDQDDPGDVVVHEATTTTVPDTTALPGPAAPPPPTVAADPTPPTAAPRHPTRVLLLGDSVAVSVRDGLQVALGDRGMTFASAAAPGCGVVTGYPAEADGTVSEITRPCNDAILERQDRSIREVRPDLVVVLSTWETTNRVVDGRWYGIGTPEWTDLLRRLYGETVDRLARDGAAVAFLTLPDVVDSETMVASGPDNRAGALVNGILRELDSRPGVTTVPFDRMVCPTTPCPTAVDGIVLRPRDGRHFEGADALRWVGTGLADQIVALDLDRL